MVESTSVFKVVLLGYSGVGKSSFLRRYLSGRFESQYTRTVGVELHNVNLSFNDGPIQFKVYDTESMGSNYNMVQDCSTAADAAILMFDVTSRVTYKDIPNWYSILQKGAPENRVSIPVVMCGNKIDQKKRKVKAKTISFHHKNNLEYHEISVKELSNIHEPFLYLARKLTGKPDLEYNPLPHVGDPLSANESSPNLPEESSQRIETKEITRKPLRTPVLAPLPFENRVKRSTTSSTYASLFRFQPDASLLGFRVDQREYIAGNGLNQDQNDTSLFILCMRCIRMIFVDTVSPNALSEFDPSRARFNLITTTCRACADQSTGNSPPSDAVKVLPDILRHTHMYDCACKAAGEEVGLIVRDRTVGYALVERLRETMGVESRIYGICTSDKVLRRLEIVSKEDVILPYVPALFL